MASPLVSVLMSVYNGIAFLEQAVMSILGQSFGDFEFIVVNDGSTEPVIEVLRNFRDPRIIIINQEHIGLARSLNKGILRCRGTYIARMDSDDISLPKRLERQILAMESDSHLDLVGCDYEVIDNHGRVWDRKILIHDKVYRLWRLMFHNVYGHGTMLIRKKAIMAVGGYNENFTVAQDYELWSRMCNLHNTFVIPDFLYQYRSVDESSQSSIRHYDAQLANAIRISNRNLIHCRPEFSKEDCEDVRSVFWKFQRHTTSRRGIELLPALLKGFFSRYGVELSDKQRLINRVMHDLASEIALEISIDDYEKCEIIRQFGRSIEHWWKEIGL